ncbi:MAG: hypothetical protein ABEJ06_05685 [Haloarculaceae archaeon]
MCVTYSIPPPYEDKEAVITNHAMEPTRFMPVYDGIIEDDQYKDIDLLGKYDGHLYDLNQKVRTELMPEFDGEDRVFGLQRMYVMRFPLISEMMNQVLIQGRNKTDAYRECRDKFEQRLGEGREKLGIGN